MGSNSILLYAATAFAKRKELLVIFSRVAAPCAACKAANYGAFDVSKEEEKIHNDKREQVGVADLAPRYLLKS